MYNRGKPAHNRDDLSNREFGWLRVKQDGSRKREGSRQLWWLCDCKCGRTVEVRGTELRAGRTTSCGCKRKLPAINYKGYYDLSGGYWYMIQQHATVKNRAFAITIEQAWQQFIRQDKRCALTGVALTLVRNYRYAKSQQTASLDRIDSSKGYTVDNIQWVHKHVNNMKQYYSQDEYINWCRLVTIHSLAA